MYVQQPNNFNENEEHTEDLTTYETQYSNSTMEFNLNIYDINIADLT